MQRLGLLLMFLAALCYGQDTTNHNRASRDSVSTLTTVFYFGGTDCPFCMDPKEIAKINAVRRNLPKIHPELRFKFVLVVMDTDIAQGIRYMHKYPKWDEVSIGSFYNNELMLAHLNQTKMPGVPQLMIFRDTLAMRHDVSVPLLKGRTLLADFVGGRQIGNWMQSNYPLKGD